MPVADNFQPVLIPDLGSRSGTEWIEDYRKAGGYKALEKALKTLTPQDVMGVVRDANLRGRGGAGFPAGIKWGFIPESLFPRYLVCNADESEPGTCKDRPIMEIRPHLLIEGMALSAYAIRSEKAFIYIRGEYYNAAKILNKAIDEAKQAGILGDKPMGKEGWSLDIVVHRGGGAYICGEESALLNSIEGRRGYPRLKPPFPAVVGLYGKPTIINNVETLATVPSIIEHGAEWFRQWIHERSAGFRLYSISGHVNRPGIYEAPMTITLGELLEGEQYGQGIRNGNKLKFAIPGGSSVPWLLPDQIDTVMSIEGVAAAGSMLGSAAIIVCDETVCPVWALMNLAHFYRHESCGQCTPCREGTAWMFKIIRRIEAGKGQKGDLELLERLAGTGIGSGLIQGRSICALGDAAAMPVASAIKRFHDEFARHIEQGACPYGKKRFWDAKGNVAAGSPA
jgi:NADH-quinone oxidoreductase subunit F